MEVKLQRKINAADTIRTWSIVRGDIVFYCCMAFYIGWGHSWKWYGETRKSLTCWPKTESSVSRGSKFCMTPGFWLFLEKATY